MGTRSQTSGKININLSLTIQNLMSKSTSQAGASITFGGAQALQNGIAANQADRGWQYSDTILSGATLVIDLASLTGLDVGAGAGLDMLGQTWDAEEIVAIGVQNLNVIGTPGYLEISPNDTNAWQPIGTHTVATNGALAAQGTLVKTQVEAGGFPISTVSPNTKIKLKANGGNVTFNFAMFARHDVETSSSSSSSSLSSLSSSSSSSSQSSSSSSSPSSQSSNSSSSSSSSSSSKSSRTSSSSSSSSSKSSQTSSSSSSSRSSMTSSSSSSSSSHP